MTAHHKWCAIPMRPLFKLDRASVGLEAGAAPPQRSLLTAPANAAVPNIPPGMSVAPCSPKKKEFASGTEANHPLEIKPSHLSSKSPRSLAWPKRSPPANATRRSSTCTPPSLPASGPPATPTSSSCLRCVPPSASLPRAPPPPSHLPPPGCGPLRPPPWPQHKADPRVQAAPSATRLGPHPWRPSPSALRPRTPPPIGKTVDTVVGRTP